MTLSPTSSVTLGKRKSHLFMCICVCVCCICKIRYFKESLCELYEVAPIKYLTHSRYSINDSYSDNAEEEAAGGQEVPWTPQFCTTEGSFSSHSM